MSTSKMKLIPVLIAGFLCVDGMAAGAQQTKRPFTVADDIGFVYFADLYGGAEAVRFSPDGNYFAVDTERARLDLNRVEDSLRFYCSQDVEKFLGQSAESQRPSPVWVVNRSEKRGAVIRGWRWLADSSGVAFLEPTAHGNQRLVLADFRKKTTKPLTSPAESVGAFDVRDRQHYVYTVADPAERDERQAERQSPAIIGTGRSLYELILPDGPRTAQIASTPGHLWAVVGGKRFEVKHDGAPVVTDGNLALSSYDNSLVTTLPVRDVPLSWETLYPPPYASYPSYRIRAGHDSAHQYVLVNLQTGSIQSLTDAPISSDAGLWAGGSPSWSSDGKEILLPGTFLKSKDNVPSRPCVALVDLPSNTRTCVEMLKAHTETGVEDGYHSIIDVRFMDGDNQQIEVKFINHLDLSFGATEYRRAAHSTWQVTGQSNGEHEIGHGGLKVSVKQWLDEPPRLVAANKQTSRVIWDPNPQLKNIELGQASVYEYKDKQGRQWKAGLYKPSDYTVGQRYPLVIQTHGFMESIFIPSGGFSTAFAARALAANGIIVLHVSDDDGCPVGTVDEGPCAVSDYEGAANQLVSQGVVDPEKIGIIGFSRTCYYVMYMITDGLVHVKAAAVTDGVMGSYWQYIANPERFSKEFNSMIGSAPFGEGLQLWLKRSPTFNIEKADTPLMIVGEGPYSLLFMWEPYAALRYLHKPVELMMLNTNEHVLTNPAVRMASQGGSVDWFRFWLQDYEDPDPAKAGQYNRWRELRKLQKQNERIK